MRLSCQDRPRLPFAVLSATLLTATLAGITPAYAGFPFLTDDPGTQGTGKVELDLFVQYSRFRGGSSGALPGVSLAYGVTDNVDLTLSMSMAMAQVDGVGTNIGFGDVAAGIKARVIEEDTEGWRPAVTFAPSVIFPSGSQARGTGLGYTRAFLPVWLGKTLGDWSVFGGGGLNINSGTIAGARQTNWWYSGIGVTYQIDDKWMVGSEVYYTSPVSKTAKNLVGFNIAVIYSIAEGHNLVALAGRNIVNSETTNQFTGLLGYQAKF